MSDRVESADDNNTGDDAPPMTTRLQVKSALGDGLPNGARWPTFRDLAPQLRALADH